MEIRFVDLNDIGIYKNRSHYEHTQYYLYERIDNGMSKLVWNVINDKNITVEKNIIIPENKHDELQYHGTHLNQGLNYYKKINASQIQPTFIYTR